jgi:aspartokinase
LSKIKIGGIVRNSNLFCISLSGSCRPTTAAVLLDALGDAGINVQFIVQGTDKDNGDLLIFCVDGLHQAETLAVVHAVQATHKFHILDISPDVTNIGIYGPDFRLRSGLASTLLGAFNHAGIHVRSISTSMSTFSVIIPSDQTELALSAIDQVFELP